MQVSLRLQAFIVMTKRELEFTLNELQTNLINDIEESYNQFSTNATKILDNLIKSTIDHSNNVIDAMKNRVSKTRIYVRKSLDHEIIKTQSNPAAIHYFSEKRQSEITLKELEENFVHKIEEPYQQFVISAKQILSSIIESSIDHSINRIDALKNSVSDIRNECGKNLNMEIIKTHNPAAIHNFRLRPLSDLVENQRLQENNDVLVQLPTEIESNNCIKEKRPSTSAVVEFIDLTVDEVNEHMNTTDYFSEDSPRVVKSRSQPKKCKSESKKVTEGSDCSKCNYSVAYTSLLHNPLCIENVSNLDNIMDITSPMNGSYEICNAEYVSENRLESINSKDVNEQLASIYKWRDFRILKKTFLSPIVYLKRIESQ